MLSGERKVEKRARQRDALRACRPRDGRGASRSRAASRSRRRLKEIDVKAKKPKRLPLQMQIAQAGLSWSKNQFLMISAGSWAWSASSPSSSWSAPLLPALGVGFAAAFGVPRWLLSFLKKRREKKFLDALSRRRRRDRARHQGRPAAARQPENHRARRAGADQERVQGDRRDADHRHADRRSLRQALRAHAAARSQLLRHRHLDPAEGRRKPVRGARQSVARAARPQEDEGQDPGHVDGSQGVRLIIGALPICVGTLVWLTSPDYIELLWTADSAAS